MLMFIVGFLVGAVMVAMTPPEYEDKARQLVLTKWKKIINKG